MRIKPEQTLFRVQTRRTQRCVVHSESLRRIIRACFISRYQRFRLADRIIQWMITRRGEQYIIHKFENPTYHCWCPSQPEDKERVECLTTSSPKEWIIKRVADGSYTCVTCTHHLLSLTLTFIRISPSDNANLFWGVEDGSNGTVVHVLTRNHFEGVLTRAA
jgi:hypothetical protein